MLAEKKLPWQQKYYKEKKKSDLIFIRIFDILISFVLLMIFLPIILVLFFLISFTQEGPVIFIQERIGKNRKRFKLYKFRTMKIGSQKIIEEEIDKKLIRKRPTVKNADKKHLTKTGRLLRKYSLDELPQLINVLRGEMSLVGPRPVIPFEVNFYQKKYFKRFSSLPGITGMAQISGRTDLSFEKIIDMDLKYVNNISVGLYLKILIKTIKVVLGGKGAY